MGLGQGKAGAALARALFYGSRLEAGRGRLTRALRRKQARLAKPWTTLGNPHRAWAMRKRRLATLTCLRLTYAPLKLGDNSLS